MSVASDMLKLVGERGDASLEFAGNGYRLSLNPIEDRFDEVGFILWQEEAGGAVPVAVGRAVRDHLVMDGEPTTLARTTDLQATIAALISGAPVVTYGGGGNEQAIPTAT